MSALPHAPAAERNAEPILAAIAPLLADVRRVLEIGAGTGQHSVRFAHALPHLVWQTSDVASNLPGIRAWHAAYPAPNLPPPIALNVDDWPWPRVQADVVFSANTAHIMSWRQVCVLFSAVGRLLPPAGRFLLYGPFNEAGQYTSESNRAFDLSLRADAPHRGIRDARALEAVAELSGLIFAGARPMPANNQLLVFRAACDEA